MRTVRHKVPRPRQGGGIGLSFCTLAPVRGRGMRRVGEANAEPTRSRVRGNFHITLTPTLTPALSRRERKFRCVPSPPSRERGRAGGRKKENPLIEYGP